MFFLQQLSSTRTTFEGRFVFLAEAVSLTEIKTLTSEKRVPLLDVREHTLGLLVL